MTALVWFRRDLRVRDHPALRAAIERHERVVPVFCFDDRLLHGRHSSGPRTQFLLECLHDLDDSLSALRGRLAIRHGPPERELATLAGEVDATEIHHTYDVSPFARDRGRRVHAALDGSPVTLVGHPGLTVADDVREIATTQGRPYSVFSPFHRNWAGQGRRSVLNAPGEVRLPPRVRIGRIPSLSALDLREEVPDAMAGGESEARRRLERFLRSGVHGYADGHDALGEDATSRLSPYLRFGCLSPRAVEERLPQGEGAQAFRRQLCWRDFYHHVLFHFPDNARHEFQDRYRGRLKWRRDDEGFSAWTEGRTGFPLVDAAMRQLRREGWMHNRARLVVGSFLTKDLGIDWRRGERWFMRWLVDGDEANNNGNWQWIASVGTDPQPVFRRIYNPALHLERHDPEGVYVRRYVPELREVPDDHLAEPWRMPEEVQRECGCLIGRDYPAPILDHRDARREALERYGSAGRRS